MSSHTSPGFTLIELIVVLSIVVIIAVIAVPRWSTSPKLEAPAQALLADIRYTQMLAITHDQRFRTNFTLPSTYSITTTSGTAVSNPSTGGNTVTLQAGTTISVLGNLPNNLIAFDEKGIPYTDAAGSVALAATATITLSNTNMTRQISITQGTGSARLT